MIETERLLLRPMISEDATELLHIFIDPKVMASFGGELFNPGQMEQWVRRNLEHQERYGYSLFSVILKETKILIGDCGLENMEVNGEIVAELGYDFRSDHWNRSYATEAARAVRDYAFQTLNLPRLVSWIRVGNGASRRVAEKVGMERSEEIERCGQPYFLYSLRRR